MNVLGAVAKGLGDVVLGSGPLDAESEAVESLLERIATVFLQEDRQVAIAKLKELVSEKPGCRQAFGAMAFPVLREVILEEANDVDAIRGVLELLHVCIDVSDQSLLDDEGMSQNATTEKLGGEDEDTKGKGKDEMDQVSRVVADQFCREDINLSMLLSLLSTNQAISDFYTRYNALKCLTSLLQVCSHTLQQHFLGSPTAVAKLMDLLTSSESMEAERNESLLLLTGLCKANVEIQKLVVFEGAFDVVFNIIAKEEQSGVIVQDCLELLIHLMTQNSSNQLLFRESGHLPKIVELLPSGGEEDNQVDSRMVFLVLEVLNVLMRSPSCSGKSDLKASQDMLLRGTNLIGVLVKMTCATQASFGKITEPVMGQAFRALSCMLKGNQPVKDVLAGMTVEWTLKQYVDVPVLHAILFRALQSKSAFERSCAMEVIESYCEDNSDGQAALASTVHSAAHEEAAEGEQSFGTFGSTLLKAISQPQQDEESLSGKVGATLVMALLVEGSSMAKDRVDSSVLSSFLRGISIEEVGDKGGENSTTNNVAGNDAPSGLASLFRAVMKLLCVWLVDSKSSIEKFFSSPSHVPLIVDIMVKGSGSGASDSVAKGLASVVLGICVLAKVENKTSSMFYNSSSLLDIVSKHIGLHKFFCAWDDMMASNDFKRGLYPLRTAKVITKKELNACFSDQTKQRDIVEAFFGSHTILSSSFCSMLKDLQPQVRQGIVSSYSGPDLTRNKSLGQDTSAVDEEVVRKLKDEIKQLRSRNESLATDLLAMSSNDASGNQGEVNEKAKQAELDLLTLETDKKIGDLQYQLRESGEKLKDMEDKCCKHENDLKDLSEAYNNLEEHSFALETKLQETEKKLEEKDDSVDAGKLVEEVEAKYMGQPSKMQSDIDQSRKLCSDLTESRDSFAEKSQALEREATGLKLKLAEMEKSLEEAANSKEAEAPATVSESVLEEVKKATLKEARLEMEEALRNKNQEHELELESLKEQLQTSQARYKEMNELYLANSSKVYTEEELMQATENARTEAAADCDEEIFQLETKLREMQANASQNNNKGDGVAAAEEGEEEEDADAELNDLLVCLGQEEKKTEILRQRLEALGENVDELLEGLEDEEEEEEEED